MKWSGGPVVATATVQGFRQVEYGTPESLRAMTVGSKLYGLSEYWSSLPPAFHAVVIWLEREHWLSQPFLPKARSRGESWIILGSEKLREGWLTRGNAPESPSVTKSRTRRSTRTLSHALRFQVLRRDGFTCQYCGRRAPEVKLHVDHVVPWSAGGGNDLENLRTACDVCNLGKGVARLG